MQRSIMRLWAAGIFALSLPWLAPALAAGAAESYPNKPVRIIVPYPPGGSTDDLGRTMAEKLSQQFKQPVIVENRPGSGSNIGAAYVAQAQPDGYTLFLGTSTALAVNPSLYKNLSFDPQKDFDPIILATMLPNIVVVPQASPVKTVPELVAAIKAGKLHNYASAGSGTPAHLGGELFKRMTGTNATHIPYKGGAPALTDLAGGQTDYMIAIMPEAMPFVTSGRLRLLAVTTAKRLPAHPNVPTLAEFVPGYELIGWYAFVAPKGTPQPILNKLNAAFNLALKDPAARSRMTGLGFEIEGGPAQRLTALMKTERVKWKQVIDEGGIKAD
jgi:tripartite-type tricarboxylate transporter receptor subunit TctC